jgi:heme/copper-type cytochrome/quinol oxidase subunit 2
MALRALIVSAGAVLPLGVAMVWLVLSPWTPPAPPNPVTADGIREVAIRAHAWGFSPRVLRVAPGETVRLVALSDDIQHGLAINELGVHLPLRPGQVVRSQAVTVNLPEGVYAIHCSTFCGLGHASMKARLVVGAPPRPPESVAPWVASLLAAAAVGGAALRAARAGGLRA